MNSNQEEESEEKRSLYGGALSINLSKIYVDLSSVREVPDHQEVFQTIKAVAGKDDEAGEEEREGGISNCRGSCFIVELLDLDIDVSDEECSNKHFVDLGEANSALNKSVTNNCNSSTGSDVQSIISGICMGDAVKERVHVGLCSGWQDMQFEEDTNNKQRIWIELCVIRLKDVSTDVLITWTIPPSQIQEECYNDNTDTFHASFMDTLSSLRINDWSLFA